MSNDIVLLACDGAPGMQQGDLPAEVVADTGVTPTSRRVPGPGGVPPFPAAATGCDSTMQPASATAQPLCADARARTSNDIAVEPAPSPAPRPLPRAAPIATDHGSVAQPQHSATPRQLPDDWPDDWPEDDTQCARGDGPGAADAVPTLPVDFANRDSSRTDFAEAAQAQDDVAAFTRWMAVNPTSAVRLDQLAGELGEIIDKKGVGSREGCTFDIELPGLGRLQARVSIRAGQADLELSAARAASSAVLRSRLQELRRLVGRESGGDVNLSIV